MSLWDTTKGFEGKHKEVNKNSTGKGGLFLLSVAGTLISIKGQLLMCLIQNCYIHALINACK